LFEGSVNTFIFHFAYNIHIVIHPIVVVAITLDTYELLILTHVGSS